MHVQSWVHSLLLIISCLVLSACPISKNPISPTSQAKYPKDLMATWVLSEDKGKGSLHLGKTPNGGITVLIVTHKDERIIEERYLGHGSQLGKEYYLNLRKIKAGKAQGDYILLHYQLKGQDLRFSVASEAAVLKAIRANTIKGEIEKVSAGKLQLDSATITASSSELARFVKTHHKQLFSNYENLRRAK